MESTRGETTTRTLQTTTGLFPHTQSSLGSESLNAFLARTAQDISLQAKLLKCRSVEEVITLGLSEGHCFNRHDLEAVSESLNAYYIPWANKGVLGRQRFFGIWDPFSTVTETWL